MNCEFLIKDYFSEHIESFTIYVTEQKFALNQGKEFFKQFAFKDHFINSNYKMKKHLSKVLNWIQKKIPNVAELTKNIISVKSVPSSSGITDLIMSLYKLFAVTEHQAAGVDVIDPIIIEEARISSKYIAQLVTMYKESIIQPAIIIILKDNDFDRAKKSLSICPHNTNVKFIRNNGKTEIYKIINIGANNINGFIDAFSRQCFSTCSKTDRKILLNSEWTENNLINILSPYFFKIRANLLFDEKPEAITDIDYILNKIFMAKRALNNNAMLVNSLEVMAKLNRIYCRDFGGEDINDVLELSKSLNIELLKAHIYRFAHFIPNITRNRQKELLQEARAIFEKNNVADHAIYCQNNFLVHSFYTDRINVRHFQDLQQQAINDVPGLVGMSIILNNVGVAHLYKRNFAEAVVYFTKGLDYSKARVVQRIGLQSNLLITKACAYERIEEKEIRLIFDAILANFSKDYLPFIAANYIMNILAISLKQHLEFGKEIFQSNKVHDILSKALINNALGSGSLTQQMIQIQTHNTDIDFSMFSMPYQTSSISGTREEFIAETGYNPIIFNAWL